MRRHSSSTLSMRIGPKSGHAVWFVHPALHQELHAASADIRRLKSEVEVISR